MRKSLTILCQPITDDGLRLNPDWKDFYHLFYAYLDELDFPYPVLSDSTRDLHQRVEFIIQKYMVYSTMIVRCRPRLRKRIQRIEIQVRSGQDGLL